VSEGTVRLGSQGRPALRGVLVSGPAAQTRPISGPASRSARATLDDRHAASGSIQRRQAHLVPAPHRPRTRNRASRNPVLIRRRNGCSTCSGQPHAQGVARSCMRCSRFYRWRVTKRSDCWYTGPSVTSRAVACSRVQHPVLARCNCFALQRLAGRAAQRVTGFVVRRRHRGRKAPLRPGCDRSVGRDVRDDALRFQRLGLRPLE